MARHNMRSRLQMLQEFLKKVSHELWNINIFSDVVEWD
jgi:hypothetical protein